ncbi:tRNA pseudouridine(13) synthase TruD [Candidatus Woesearchaeota archaeon]|nr:tRNA pseudouridine(13) synthase TruD [Candidatus Woesearchaeota archaeon]
MYILKEQPEDFIVKEQALKVPKDQGTYAYYFLKKKNYTTLKAIQIIANAWNIPQKYMGFAGNKDKIAVTEQMISIKDGPSRNLEQKEISLTFLGRGDERINLGDLQGNAFVITVRNFESKSDLHPAKLLNFFDEQRFGKDGNNSTIGKALLKKQFKQALELMNNRSLNSYLENHPNDYVGALRLLPKKLLKLYVHSFQSYLWNTVVKTLLDQGAVLEKVPLYSFDTEFSERNLEVIYEKLMAEEGVSPRDFIMTSLPDITPSTVLRDVYMEAAGFSCSYAADELHEGRWKCVLAFILPPGSYATMVVKQLF